MSTSETVQAAQRLLAEREQHPLDPSMQRATEVFHEATKPKRRGQGVEG